MPRMNGRTRMAFYDILTRRDGDFCRMCRILASVRQLVIDHIDNDNDNNRLDNLQLLCRACNYRKNSRRPVATCVSSGSEALGINRTKEPQYREFVYNELESVNREYPGSAVSKRMLIYAGAERVGVSPVTSKRYLDKLCSRDGRLEYIGDDYDFVGYREASSNQ